MERLSPRFLRVPDRFPPARARLLLALAAFVIALGLSGVWLYDGAARVAIPLALVLVGLGNVTLGLGSLLPEERGGKAARGASLPIAILMFPALFAAVALILTGRA